MGMGIVMGMLNTIRTLNKTHKNRNTMKKLLLVCATTTCLALSIVGAQGAPKGGETLVKKLERSDLSVLDAKKVQLFGTWIDRANTLLEVSKGYTGQLVFDLPTSQLFPMLPEQPVRIEQVSDMGTAQTRYVFANFDLYTDAQDNVVAWFANKEMKPGALELVFDALTRAKAISPGEFMGKGYFAVESLWNEYKTAGISYYYTGQKIKAAEEFKKAIRVQALRDEQDALMTYQAGVAYMEAGEKDSALVFLGKAMELGNEADGDVPYYMALIQEERGDREAAIVLLDSAAAKYPTDNRIMTQLIKLYVDTDKDPQKIVTLIAEAKKLDPENIQLYMIEGMLWNRLGENDKSAEVFAQAIAKDPTNAQAYKNVGILQYELGDEMTEKANTAFGNNDMAAYDALTAQARPIYAKAIEMFEKVHELDAADADVIDWLRRLYYPIRDVQANRARFDYFTTLYNQL